MKTEKKNRQQVGGQQVGAKNVKKTLSIAFMLALCSLLFVTGCQNPLTLDNTIDIPEGKGALSLRLSYEGRTILPGNLTKSNFAVYELTFTPQGGTAVVENRDNTTLSTQPIILDPGTYTLVIYAYRDAAKSALLARGSADVVITVGQNTPANVTLNALLTEGSGTFKWNITLPQGVTTASMLIKKDTTEQTVNLLTEANGTKTLSSGQYSVTINLEGSSGKVIWKELLYVYMNLESAFTKTFTNDHFVNSIYTVTFDANGGTVINGTQSALHGDTITAPGVPTKATTPNFFAGWFKDEALENQWDFTTDTVTGDITLYAKWTISGNINTNPSAGSYNGKDVLGNNYSLTLGSAPSASIRGRAVGRAANRGDRYTMTVTPRDGKHRTISGTITGISADGTLTLETDTGEAFTALVGGSDDLNSVAGVGDEMPQIPFTGDTIGGSNTLTPRSFDEIYLRATRWTGSDGGSGEHWGSLKSVLLRDYPTNVSTLQPNNGGRYSITLSGTTNVPLPYLNIEVQGLDENEEWHWLTGFEAYDTVTTSGYFEVTRDLSGVGNTVNLLDYSEIILQVTNVMKYTDPNNSSYSKNNGEIPADIPDGQIMAIINDFSISLKDKSRDEFAGNMNDFHYGVKEDGMSRDYKRAEWHLTAENVRDAQKPGAKFEFIMTGLDDGIEFDYLETEGMSLGFAWQDPVRELWWQDEYHISGYVDRNGNNNWTYVIGEGVYWVPHEKKIRLDLDKMIEDNRFYNAAELNFEIGYWWRNDQSPDCIDELAISGANIIAPTNPVTGNMGTWYYGYLSNGISLNYQQAVWYNLPSDVLATAREPGAAFVLGFNQDIIGGGNENPHLILLWQNPETNRWWPNDPDGSLIQTYTLGNWQDGVGTYDPLNGYYVLHNGVTYDHGEKKLTVVLEDALESYSDFIAAAGQINFLVSYVYPDDANVNSLGMVSANIVDSGMIPPAGWIDPSTQTTPLTGGTQLLSYTSGSKPLTDSPYSYETWDFSNGVGSTNKFTWYGPDQGGGGAFKAEWNSYFLARLGYYWGDGGSYTNFNNIYADYNYARSNNASSPSGGFIGMYGWSRNSSATEPINKLIEYYIVDDWFWDDVQMGINRIGTGQGADAPTELGSFVVDGATYKIYKNPRNQEPSIDGTQTFIQIFSVRQGRRTSGTISVTEHFKAWSHYLELGSMYEAKFKVEAFANWSTPLANYGNLDLRYLYLAQEADSRGGQTVGRNHVDYVPPFGAQPDRSFKLDPAGFTVWYDASKAGATISFTGQSYGGVYYNYPNGFDITDYGSLEIVYTVSNVVDTAPAADPKKDGAAITIAVYSDALGEGNSGKDAKYTALSQTANSTLTIDEQGNKDGKAFNFYWNSTDGSKGFVIKVNSYDTDDTFDVTFHSITFKPVQQP